MFYSYCRAFKINPNEALNTPVSLIKKMLLIHGVAKELEHEELEKAKKQQ
mgnify:CR=1 FL=1|jgi:hypothetical protein|tara:strand:- start:205 stop:354 length:150 start_codon:yes stop_codon:yes gene_type:complete